MIMLNKLEKKNIKNRVNEQKWLSAVFSVGTDCPCAPTTHHKYFLLNQKYGGKVYKNGRTQH